MLKTTAAAGVAAAGVGTASNSASAQLLGGGIGGIGMTELDFRNGTPSASEIPTGDEIHLSIHGYMGSMASTSQAGTFESTAQGLGYDGEVVAVTWDDGGGPIGAESNARDAGQRLAGVLDQYKSQNPGTAVRLLGHSMGGFVVMECVGALNTTIENADMIGSYEEADAPCEGNFYSAIESNCEFMGNYHSTNDMIARLGQGGASCGGLGGGLFGQFGGGLFGGDSGGGFTGGGGGGGSTPSNYQDVDVSSSVSSHMGYKSSSGCVQQILSNYVAPTGGSGGTSGTGGQTGGQTGGMTDGGLTSGGFTGGDSGGFTGGSSGFTSGGLTGGSSGGFTSGSSGGFTSGGSMFGGSSGGLFGGGLF